eukprot:gene10840-14551_t
MVKEISSLAEFEQELKSPGLVVVDFFTTWCGPCKQIAPILEQFAAKYPEVKFIKVDIEKNADINEIKRISSIPTFHFYVNSVLKDELKGANASAIEAKIVQHKVNVDPFGGSKGFKLASGDSDASVMSAREARLKAFGKFEDPVKDKSTSTSLPSALSSKVLANDGLEEDEALAKALELSLADGSSSKNNDGSGVKATTNVKVSTESKNSTQDEADYAAAEAELVAFEESNKPKDEWDEEMVPVPVNNDLLNELIEMGFPDVRARKGLVHGSTLDGAIAWLDQHQDDADIDQPYMVKKSDTIPKPPLTAEEKALRVQAIKDRVKKRREERSVNEKADEIRREKERRERGQKIDETLEERQAAQRKREQAKLKKEKDDAARERERLKAEIARDKELRRANKGVLPSVLGVDGYNPSIIQYDQKPSAATSNIENEMKPDESSVPAKRPVATTSTTSTTSQQAAPKKATPNVSKSTTSSTATELDPTQKIDSAIQTLMRYRTGGDGGNALKLLLTFVKNVVDNPNDPKYQSINPESAAFKSKLSPLVGPMLILKAVGFEKNEEDGKLKFNGPLLDTAVAKLTEAEALYRRQNP